MSSLRANPVLRIANESIQRRAIDWHLKRSRSVPPQRPGDSLLGIALKFRTDVPTLLRANRLTTPASFNVCSTLLVPSSGVDVGTLLDEQATAQEEEVRSTDLRRRQTAPACQTLILIVTGESSGHAYGPPFPAPTTVQTARVRAAKVSLLRAAAKREQGSSREHVMTEQEAEFYLTEADGDFQAARRCASCKRAISDST